MALGLLAIGDAEGLPAAARPALADGGATYYVAPGGNDGNPCSAAAPCASLLHATGQATAGDTVLVESGTYGPQTISAQGAPGRPVTVAAQGSVTLTRPLPLTTSSQGTALLRVVDSAYVTVQGFTVLGAKTQPGYDANTQPYGGDVEVENHVVLPGAGITLQGLAVSHANNTCIKLQDHEPDAAIISNTVSDCGSPASSGNLDQGIYTSGPGTLIAGNTVSGATGYGIQAWPTGGGDVGGATIRDNTVHDNALYGIVTGGSPVTIAENLVYSNAQGGIDVVDYAHTPTTTLPDVIAGNVLNSNGSTQNPGTAQLSLGNSTSAGTLIANNTFYRGARFAIASVQGMGGQYTATLRVENNIFYGDPQAYGAPNTGLFNDPLPAGSLVDYNLYYNVKPYGSTNAPPSYDGGHSRMQMDPRFVNPGATPLPNLQLQSSSPAIGAGTTVNLPDGTALSRDLGARWCGATFCDASATSTAVPANSPTATVAPAFTPTSAPTATPTHTATRVPPAATNTATATPGVTNTPSPSPTRTMTATPVPPRATSTATATNTPAATWTPMATPRPANTATPRPLATATMPPAPPAPAPPTWTAVSGPAPRPTNTAVAPPAPPAPSATPALRPPAPRYTPRPRPTSTLVPTRTPQPRYRSTARQHPTSTPTPRGQRGASRAVRPSTPRAASTRPIVTVALPRNHVVANGPLVMHVQTRPHARLAITVAITRRATTSRTKAKRATSHPHRTSTQHVTVLYQTHLTVRADGKGRATPRVRVVYHASTAVQGQLLLTTHGPLGTFTYRTGITIRAPGRQHHRSATRH